MSSQAFSAGCLIFLFTLMSCTKSLRYEDLIETGMYCPSRDKCKGYKGGLTYKDRNCECDTNCASYKDCCIDGGRPRRRNVRHRTNIGCLSFGLYNGVVYDPNKDDGVYVVNECSRNWTGSSEVREKCIGPLDLSDLINAVPVTSIQGNRSTSYKNIFCAQCNFANINSLKFHQIQFSCFDLQNITRTEFLNDLTYNDVIGQWGVYRRNSDNRFIGCRILFHVPDYLYSSVRFCRPFVVSTCASDWTDPQIKKYCRKYMAVVYDRNSKPYRNPHCAICNHRNPTELRCLPMHHDDFLIRPFSFTLLVDMNQEGVSTSECPSNQIYDPFFKRCKSKLCALAGYRLFNGQCVKS